MGRSGIHPYHTPRLNTAKAVSSMPSVKDIARAMPATEEAEPAMYNPKSKQQHPIKPAYFGQELAKVVAPKADSMVAF